MLRDGFQPNTLVGQFWRFALRNLAGFLLHKNDKCTFGNTWRVVMAENEAVLEEIGWNTTAEDLGIPKDKSAVSIARYTGSDLIASATGDTGEKMMPYLADARIRKNFNILRFCPPIFAILGGKTPPCMIDPHSIWVNPEVPSYSKLGFKTLLPPRS